MTNFAKRIDKTIAVFNKAITSLDCVLEDTSREVGKIDTLMKELSSDRKELINQTDRAITLRDNIKKMIGVN